MKFLPSMALLGALSLPVFAPDAVAQSAPSPYETQKKQLKASAVDSLAELAAFAKTGVNKSVEVRGVVKGIFSRGADQFAVMLQVPAGETLVVAAPVELRSNRALSSGKWVRLLCKVNGYSGSDVELLLQNATDRAEVGGAVDAPNYGADEIVVQTQNKRPAPRPDDVIIASEVTLPPTLLPPPPGAVAASAPQAPRVLSSASSAPAPTRGNVASRRAVVPRSGVVSGSRSSRNPYFGFEDSHRSAFANLARRTNPRLSVEMADNIAAAILAASKAHSLDPRFLAAVVQVESQFNPYAVSGSGAMGLGQLMPFNLKPLGVGNAWDPHQNLHGAAKMLRQNLNTYAKMENGTLLAVAAYHAGVGAVRRAGYQVPKISTNRYAWKVYYAYKALAPELF